MYKKHYDHVNKQWNVYLVQGGRENFITSFKDARVAQDYCDAENEKLQDALDYLMEQGIEVKA